jgi:transposase-like protein
MSTVSERQRRRFSEEIKREVVKRVEKREQSLLSISRELEVSPSAIYKWLAKYSVTYQKQHRVIVEKKSYQSKVKQLEDRLKDLEAALGRKQMHIDFLEKLIDIAEREEGMSIRKKGEQPPLNGSDSTGKPIRGQ